MSRAFCSRKNECMGVKSCHYNANAAAPPRVLAVPKDFMQVRGDTVQPLSSRDNACALAAADKRALQ